MCLDDDDDDDGRSGNFIFHLTQLTAVYVAALARDVFLSVSYRGFWRRPDVYKFRLVVAGEPVA